MLAIIQARSSSNRLKNKILLKVKNKPLIWHVVNSVQKSKNVKKIIVATSKDKSDDYLVKYMKKNRMNYYRGSLNNVAERLCTVAEKNKSKFFLRISGDSPLLDKRIIDQSIKLFKKLKFNEFDLITNIFPRTFPPGQSVEIIKTSSLRKILKSKLSILNQEHVTRYFYKKSKDFKIKNFVSSFTFEKKKYSIDTIQDFENLKDTIKI